LIGSEIEKRQRLTAETLSHGEDAEKHKGWILGSVTVSTDGGDWESAENVS